MSSYPDFDNDDERYEYGTSGSSSYEYGERSYIEQGHSHDNDDERYEYGTSGSSSYEYGERSYIEQGHSHDNDDERYEYGTSGSSSYEYGERSYIEQGHSHDNDDERYEYGLVSQAQSETYAVAETFGFKLELGRENKVFTFDTTGAVTAVGEIGRNGQIKAERIDFNETYEMVGDFVVKTETSRYGQTEWSVYADGDGDNRWAEIAEGHGPVSAELLAQLIPVNLATFG